jgi:cytochrome P450
VVADLVPTLTELVPVLTICELLGLPAADAARIKAWTADFTDGLEPWGDADAEARAGAALEAMSAYLAPVLDERAAGPGDDPLSVLATSADLAADEKLQNGLLLLNAGLDTSSDLLANLLAALAARPDLWSALRDDPDRWIGPFVEESLRLDSPVQFTMRRTVEPVELDGVEIPAAEPVLLAVGSANRDPAAFADPDAFDPGRFDRDPKLRQVGFGGGAHLCLGAPLARLEAAAVLRALVGRYAAIAPGGPMPWRRRSFFRGRAAVPVLLTP